MRGDSKGQVVFAPIGWRAARLSLSFVLDVARISRGDGDLLQPLILTAILQANQAPLENDAELRRRFGDGDAPLPDSLRRPISINGLAQSLGLPFETVRRRTAVFLGAGLCVTTPEGVYVPEAVVTSPAYCAVQSRRVQRLALFLEDLVQAGITPSRPGRQAIITHGVRAADRAVANYMLRACDALIGLFGGAADGMVMLGLCEANIRHLAPAAFAGPLQSFDDLARPCGYVPLARELGMSAETVRRRLLGLQSAGFCDARPEGWMVLLASENQARLRAVIDGNLVNLRRLVAQLEDVKARSAGSLGAAAT